MGFFHRKILQKSTEIILVINGRLPCNSFPCHQHFIPPLDPPRCPPSPPPPPPPPPPAPQSSKDSLSPILILLFCGLAISFSFICYLTCATRYRRPQRNHENRDHETREDFVNEDVGPVIHHPIWLISTTGLHRSQIESIHVFKYKSDEKLIEGTDCSVCLSEFEDDETLRLLPKCNHAFHVPCIDTWLRYHKNCPLCRAPIFKNTNDHEPNSIESSTSVGTETETETETEANDSEAIGGDDHVVEVETNGEVVKTSANDLATHHHVHGEELVAMRRSFSSGRLIESKKPSSVSMSGTKLNGSSSSTNVGRKVGKSSSLA